MKCTSQQPKKHTNYFKDIICFLEYIPKEFASI